MATRNGSKVGKVLEILKELPKDASMKTIQAACKKAKISPISYATIYSAKNKLKNGNKIESIDNTPIILPSQVFSPTHIQHVLIMKDAIERVGLSDAQQILSSMSKIK